MKILQMKAGRKLLAAILCLTTSVAALADLSPDFINQCTTAITTPDFASQASNLAALLDSCMANNVCSKINNVDNCANTLATRDFLSNYLAAAPAKDSPIPPSFFPQASTPTVTNKNNNSAPIFNNTDNNSNTETTPTNTTKDIRWF